MNNATLIYKINDNNKLRLESYPLNLIDKITSSFKNEDDFINHYYNKEQIEKFVKDNNNVKGSIVIDFKKDLDYKEELKPLFNVNEEIVTKDDFYDNISTEIEKARKLLFNSKNQIFTKLILKSNLFSNELDRYVDLNEDEARYAINNNIDIKQINSLYLISFKTLLLYRINNNKLGKLRDAYQDMLNILKRRINEKDFNEVYFFNRELKLIINKYNDIIGDIVVKNLKVYNISKKELKKYGINNKNNLI